MSIKLCGAFSRRTEHPDFHMKLDKGENCWLVLHFCDPMIVTIGGRQILTEQDACLIYAPGQPQDYRPQEGGFTNDYVKFLADGEEPVSDAGLPVGEIFYISPSYKFTESIDHICWCLTDKLNDHEAEMGQCLLAVLKEMAEHRMDRSPRSKKDDMTLKRLGRIRSDMKGAPYDWSVEKMAASFYMTRSHFSVLYKRHFGISPGADLRNALMDHAKKLLTETSMSVDEIASVCGYGSSENFIRSFKRTFGITPLKYRKTH